MSRSREDSLTDDETLNTDEEKVNRNFKSHFHQNHLDRLHQGTAFY